MAEEKKAPTRAAGEGSKKYTGLPGGEHAGIPDHKTVTIPESGTYETSDPGEQAFIEGILGGTPTE